MGVLVHRSFTTNIQEEPPPRNSERLRPERVCKCSVSCPIEDGRRFMFENSVRPTTMSKACARAARSMMKERQPRWSARLPRVQDRQVFPALVIGDLEIQARAGAPLIKVCGRLHGERAARPMCAGLESRGLIGGRQSLVHLVRRAAADPRYAAISPRICHTRFHSPLTPRLPTITLTLYLP